MAVGLVILGGCLYFLLRRSKKNTETRRQPAGLLYIDGISEMDAGPNRQRENRDREIVTHRHHVELDGRDEISGSR